MKKILLIFSFVLISFLGFAQGVLSFEKTEFDFGPIEEGVQATHVFTFKNTGNAPVILSNVQASCGCTTPEWPKEPIAPGATASIKAVYNSQGRPGNFFKTITITSNASEPSVQLKISGIVISAGSSVKTAGSTTITADLGELKLANAEHNFGKIQKGEKVSYKLNISNPGKAELRVESVYSGCQCVTLANKGVTVTPGGQGTLELIYSPTKVSTSPEKVIIINNGKSRTVDFFLKGEVVENMVNNSVLKEGSTGSPFGN